MRSTRWHYLHSCFTYGLGIILTFNMASIFADELHLAVAASFIKPIKQLKQYFENNSQHRIIISFGATGQLYAQVKHGATFDIFLAADMKHPKRLISEGMAVNSSLFTYAVGKLVLWSPQPNLVDKEGKVLSRDKFKYLAIAHPKMAPYGTAARQVLEKMGLWQTVQNKIVRGNFSKIISFTSDDPESLVRKVA